jgi:hypothetical protein
MYCAENYDITGNCARCVALFCNEIGSTECFRLDQAGCCRSSDREAGRAVCLLISVLEEFL